MCSKNQIFLSIDFNVVDIFARTNTACLTGQTIWGGVWTVYLKNIRNRRCFSQFVSCKAWFAGHFSRQSSWNLPAHRQLPRLPGSF